MARDRSATLTIRLPQKIRDEIDAVSAAHPYRPTTTAIVERGIYLALREMEIMADTADAAIHSRHSWFGREVGKVENAE